MQRRLVLLALLAVGCGQRAPGPVAVVVAPPVAEVAPARPVAPTKPPSPPPAELVALPADAGGKAVAGFLAARDLPEPRTVPAVGPVAAAGVRFDAPLATAPVALPQPRPASLPPILTRRVGPRASPEPTAPATPAPTPLDYALTPRRVEPWRLPPKVDPLALLDVPPAERRPEARGRPESPSADAMARRVAAVPGGGEFTSKLVPMVVPPRLGGEAAEVGLEPARQ